MYRVDSIDGLHLTTPISAVDSCYTEYSDVSSLDSCMTESANSNIHYNTLASMDKTSEDMAKFSADTMSFSNTADLCDDLRFIMAMPEMCDVKFLVGREKTPVHAVKAILATRSREFYKMILTNQRSSTTRQIETPKKSNSILSKLRKLRRRSAPPSSKPVTSASGHLTIDIDEFDVDSFRRVIAYLHSGSINVNIDTVIGVMNAADSYGLEDLRVACFQFAGKLIDTNSVLQLLTSAEKYVSFRWTRYIKAEILEFIAEKAQDVLRHPEFEQISKQAAVLIFLRPELKATEETKWDAALRWSRRYCSKREMNLFRSTIKIFTPRINFNDISLEKLTNEIRPLSILPENLINRAIAHQNSPRFVIGQERTPFAAPQKPPRRRNNVRRALPLTAGTPYRSAIVQRKLSSASECGSTDSGLASSMDDCSMV